jgi:NAD(P)-dependent dehydrogenase (short-subunit alcohol dehydrogenase family)
MGLADVATKDGYDVQMQTNHLSHFLLTKELYPLLQRAKELRGEARVVNHTSEARRVPAVPARPEYYEKKGGKLGGDRNGIFFGGPRFDRYHQSKLANAVYTLALKDRLGESGIKAACAAPGLAATNLQVTSHQAGSMGLKEMIMLWLMYQSGEDGSMPLLKACFDPATQNGDLFEPSGWMAVKGPPVKVEYDALSADPEARKLLWEKSEEACGKFEI